MVGRVEAIAGAKVTLEDAAGEPSLTSFGHVKLRVVTRVIDLPKAPLRFASNILWSSVYR